MGDPQKIKSVRIRNIYVKNDINGDIYGDVEEHSSLLERVGEEDLKVRKGEKSPFLSFFSSFISPGFHCLMQRKRGRKVILYE
jgi:hypothetical protein